MRYLLLLFFCTICCCIPAQAKVELPSLFSDNMVLQCDKPIAIWGTAEPGELVGIKLAEQAAVATADAKGHWLVTLKKTPAGGPFTLSVHGKNDIAIKNVMVGEVWMLVGSTCMGASYSSCTHSEQDTKEANLADLRLFKVPDNMAPKPMTETKGDWIPSTGDSIQSFSSIGFYVGRDLQKKLNVPVGIIQATYPASPIETWVSREATDNSKDFKNLGGHSELADEEYRIVQGRYQEALDTWNEQCEEARKAHKPEPPTPPLPPPRRMGLVGSAFNGEISPVAPYTVRGILFYEGENDVSPGATGGGAAIRWRKLFDIFVADIRKRFNDPELPFYFVQLPNQGKRTDKPGESAFAEIREAQAQSGRGKTFLHMVNTIDTDPGAVVDINPPDKRMIAMRLSRAVMATQYHLAVPYASPFYEPKSLEISGNKVRLHFRNAEKGLISKGLPVQGFEVSGEDEKFVRANAELDGDTVLVWSDKVAKPVAVRYGWADNPAVSLYSADKLPVLPFRTDDWKSANKPDPKAAKK